MGLFSSNKFHAVSPNLGLFPLFCRNQQTTLILKERILSWTGDDFSVHDQDGRTVVTCKAHKLSTRDRKTFTGPDGKVLFTLRNKMITIHRKFVAEDESGKDLFTIGKKMSLTTAKAEVEFTNAANGKSEKLHLYGDWVKGGADIKWDDQTIAHISRHIMGAREVMDDKQTYYVTVAPGVDLALIAAICISFDELEHDEN